MGIHKKSAESTNQNPSSLEKARNPKDYSSYYTVKAVFYYVTGITKVPGR